MSHWRIDNPCLGHAPFQSFTPRFPLPIYTTCSCLMPRPAESLASRFLCCSNVPRWMWSAPAEGSRRAQQLCDCKSRTHTRRLCHLHMLYNMLQRADWQYYGAAGRSERLSPLQISLWNSGGFVVCTCKVAQLNRIFSLLSCSRLQASLPLLHLWSDLQPRGGVHHYSKCLLTTGIRHNRQLGLKERAANGLV